MLDAEYGPTAANMIRNAGLMEHPLRIAINADWDNKVNGECEVQTHAAAAAAHGASHFVIAVLHGRQRAVV